jgi:antirestriction protein ArdC
MNREEAQKASSTAIDELVKALEEGKSETLIRYLAMLAKFHNYSFGNCLLIALQRPDATYVAGFHRWKELNRFVKKGEKGIAIIAPISRKRKADDADRDDESAGGRYVSGFRVVYVFDVTQTEGEPLEEFASSSGEPGEHLPRLEELIAREGVTLLYELLPGGANGVSEGGTIRVRPDLSPSETFRVLVHELAHERLHQKERRKETTKAIRETEAEAVAFVVSHAYGIDSTTRSSDYVQIWGGDKELLLQSLDHIQAVAADIITSLDKVQEEVPHAA